MTTPDYAGLEALEQAIIGYWGNRCSDFDGNCPCCQSWKQFDALRTLLESNAALERERTNLIETKREQIGRLQKERDAWRKECEKLSTVWAENHSRNKRAEAAEARVKELELMLRSANSMQQKTSTSMTDWVRRAEAAEAKLAEAMKVIGQIDNALNDQFAAGIEEREGGSARRQERLMKSGEELRRAARKFLKENGNGE